MRNFCFTCENFLHLGKNDCNSWPRDLWRRLVVMFQSETVFLFWVSMQGVIRIFLSSL